MHELRLPGDKPPNRRIKIGQSLPLTGIPEPFAPLSAKEIKGGNPQMPPQIPILGKETPKPTGIPSQTELSAKNRPLLDKVLARRGLDRAAVEEIRRAVPFPDIILTPTNSALKANFLKGFMKELAPDKSIIVRGIKVSSDVHEQPFGPETKRGARHRMENALAKAQSGDTGNAELDQLLAGKTLGYIGAIENGMVAGATDSEGKVHLDHAQTIYKSTDEHFDVAYATINFPPLGPITAVSPPEEAVRFNPLDTDASAAAGFDITAGQLMQERLAKGGINVDKQNWHGYTVQKEIEAGLRPDSDAGFDRFEQLAGVLFDAFYQLAQQIKKTSQ